MKRPQVSEESRVINDAIDQADSLYRKASSRAATLAMAALIEGGFEGLAAATQRVLDDAGGMLNDALGSLKSDTITDLVGIGMTLEDATAKADEVFVPAI